MKRRITALVLVSSLMCAVLAIVIYASKRVRGTHAPYTIISENKVIHANGTVELTSQSVKFVDSHGNFREEIRRADGIVVVHFGEVGRGSFAVDETNKILKYRSSWSGLKATAEEIRRNPNFNREETVLGYKVMVDRFTVGNDGFGEVYRAPDLNGDLIKEIQVRGDMRYTTEPISIEVGEPSAANMRRPEYPVNFDYHRRLRGEPTEAQKQAAERVQ